jgi:hypothetical protein
MHAANRNAVGKYQIAFMENGNARGSPAHLDQNGPKYRFILGQHRFASRIGRYNIARNGKMGPLNGQGKVSQVG